VSRLLVVVVIGVLLTLFVLYLVKLSENEFLNGLGILLIASFFIAIILRLIKK